MASHLKRPAKNAPPARKRAWEEETIGELFWAGATDSQMAESLGWSILDLRERRDGLGYKRPLRRWPRESILEAARAWYQRFGSLSAIDWNPSMAIAAGHSEWAERFYEFGEAPHTNTVLKHFPSWSAMKEEAGIPASPVGRGARVNQRAA